MTSNASYQLENMQKLEIFASFPGNIRIKHSWITFIQAKSGGIHQHEVMKCNMKWNSVTFLLIFFQNFRKDLLLKEG